MKSVFRKKMVTKINWNKLNFYVSESNFELHFRASNFERQFRASNLARAFRNTVFICYCYCLLFLLCFQLVLSVFTVFYWFYWFFRFFLIFSDFFWIFLSFNCFYWFPSLNFLSCLFLTSFWSLFYYILSQYLQNLMRNFFV